MIITSQRSEKIENAMKEIFNEVLLENTYVFEKGKIFGVVCEQGGGGEFLSSLITGRINVDNERAYIDGIEVPFSEIQEKAWYVGKCEYSKLFSKHEISVEKAIERTIRKYKCYQDKDDLIEQFGLSKDRLKYKISDYSGEKWRVSLALGYASKRTIFCFPWMNTLYFNHIMLSSGVYRFFKKMKEDGMIIILPTSRRKNVEAIADVIIEINHPSFSFVATEHPDFISFF